MSPHARFTHSHRGKPSRLGRASIAVAACAFVALTVGASPVAAKTAKATPAPVKLTVFSPTAGDTAGVDGAGFVVDVALTARNKTGNSLLSADAGYKPFFNNPTSSTFKPGPDDGAPGLVVLLSTTPNTPGTPFQGANTNLAGLFQINGVGTVKGGLAQTWNTWQIGRAGFGSGPSMLTVFVVKGTAPAVVPDTGLELISNVVKVPFTITSPGVATAAPTIPAN